MPIEKHKQEEWPFKSSFDVWQLSTDITLTLKSVQEANTTRNIDRSRDDLMFL